MAPLGVVVGVTFGDSAISGSHGEGGTGDPVVGDNATGDNARATIQVLNPSSTSAESYGTPR